MYYVIGVIVLVVVFFVISVRNKIVKLKIGADNAFSAMDVFLKKRYDLIPDLVAAVRAYDKHERDTFINTTNARSKAMESNNINDIARENENINDYISKIFIIAEDYPELKASDNYIKLTSEMTHLEKQIADARLYYNGFVTEYNININTFPNNVIASIFGYKNYDLFKTDINERANVNIGSL